MVHVNVQVAEQPPPPSCPSYAAAVSSGGVGGASRPATADPTHQAMHPSNQPSTPGSGTNNSCRDPSLVDTLLSNQSPVRTDGNFIVTSPGGTELAVLQPVAPGIPQLDGEDEETSDEETSEDESPDADSRSPAKEQQQPSLEEILHVVQETAEKKLEKKLDKKFQEFLEKIRNSQV